MDSSFMIGLAAWLIPGAGHLLQKKWVRGGLIAGIFWIMFGVAIWSGGAYYPGFSFSDGALLYLLNFFGRCGSGVGAILGYLAASGPATKAAASATFEYGGRFLEVVGLLNYLAVLDAVDIYLGRKK